MNHLERITRKLLDFGAAHKLDCAVDAAGNVRLRKAASAGYEKATAIVIQSHMDVVCSKSNDKVHDFTVDPVTPIIEGNVLRADRTTLGADDGIGVAAAMALLEEPTCTSDSAEGAFVHGPLEAVFTVDEETTMGGAEGIAKAPFLQSSVLINVDSEESGSICVGCAGGFEKKLFLPLVRTAVDAAGADAGKVALRLHLHSLLGGHTGIDIHKGRANALILVARMLNAAQTGGQVQGLQLLSLAGGNAPNAIPRDATFEVLLPSAEVAAFKASLAATFQRIQSEFQHIERKLAPGQDEAAAAGPDAKYVPTMVLDTVSEEGAKGGFAASVADSRKIVNLLLSVPHGPLKINVDLDHAVDTSISFSMLSLPAEPPSAAAAASSEAGGDALTVHVFSRSSFDKDMRDVDARLVALAELSGCRYTVCQNPFPGWDPRLDSPALKQVIATHRALFATDPKVYSVHAGLECGLFKLAYPDLDCVSIGPTIHHAHSPQECLMIDTVAPFYAWLKQSIVAITKDSVKKQ